MMNELGIIISSVLSIIGGMLIIPFLSPGKKAVFGFIVVIMNAIVTSIPAFQVLSANNTLQTYFSAAYPFQDIAARLDPLAAWFILIINLTCLNGALYGIGYMNPYKGQSKNTSLHWILVPLFQLSMICVCLLQHSLAFLVAWEIMSLSSFLLVIFDHGKQGTLKAGINYLVQMHIGVALLTVGFIAVYLSQGSFDFLAIRSYLATHHSIWIFILFLAGFGIKAGFIPLHTWLPHAHPAAPSHISGIMSGVIVKLGIYGILRLITFLDFDLLQVGEAILVLSLGTALYGILNGAVHRDFKRMLAFCTIENIGIIGIAIGMGMIGKAVGNHLISFIGFSAALLHTLNHSLYKSLLFFTAGNLYQQTHTRDMEQLGGLAKKMPTTAFLYICGSMAICALPPFNGFVSEFLIYSGLIEGIKSGNVQVDLLMIASIATLALIGGISLLTFTKSYGTIFLGTPRTTLTHQPKEVTTEMKAPLFIILALMLAIGIFPNAALASVSKVVMIFDPNYKANYTTTGLPIAMALLGRASLVLAVLSLFIYYLRTVIAKKRTSIILPTWGCGYVKPNAKMQYTGKSFTKSLAKLFSYFTAEKKKYHEIESSVIFPAPRSYQSHYSEFFETRIIDKANNRLIGFINYFSFIHNGQTQMYVLYGLFFIVALIAATFLNLL